MFEMEDEETQKAWKEGDSNSLQRMLKNMLQKASDVDASRYGMSSHAGLCC